MSRRDRLFVLSLVGSLLIGTGNLTSASDPENSKAQQSSPSLPIGEKLIFRVEWKPPWYLFFLPTMEAGEVELNLAGETVFNEMKALKIVFKARSSGTLVRLAGVTVDDHFEFITDPETLCTMNVTKRMREGKRKRDIDVTYFPLNRRLHIRELDVATNPSKVKRDESIQNIPECVKDLFSALYSVRRSEIRQGMSHHYVVGDNARVKGVEVRVEKSEIVETPKGRYETWKLNTVALLGGLFKEGGQFNFWLTKDERRVPVQFEAQVSLGRVSGKLRGVEP